MNYSIGLRAARAHGESLISSFYCRLRPVCPAADRASINPCKIVRLINNVSTPQLTYQIGCLWSYRQELVNTHTKKSAFGRDAQSLGKAGAGDIRFEGKGSNGLVYFR